MVMAKRGKKFSPHSLPTSRRKQKKINHFERHMFRQLSFLASVFLKICVHKGIFSFCTRTFRLSYCLRLFINLFHLICHYNKFNSYILSFLLQSDVILLRKIHKKIRNFFVVQPFEPIKKELFYQSKKWLKIKIQI